MFPARPFLAPQESLEEEDAETPPHLPPALLRGGDPIDILEDDMDAVSNGVLLMDSTTVLLSLVLWNGK